jgi:mannose-6-phosphate isomerase-like protein (cupin superfamily)
VAEGDPVTEHGLVRATLEGGSIVEETENAATVRSLLRYEDCYASFSVAWVRLAGHHRRLLTRRSARCYYVLEGALTCTLADHRSECLAANELVVVPPGTPYELDGTATYLVWNVPAFQPGDDEYLE